VLGFVSFVLGFVSFVLGFVGRFFLTEGGGGNEAEGNGEGADEVTHGNSLNVSG